MQQRVALQLPQALPVVAFQAFVFIFMRVTGEAVFHNKTLKDFTDRVRFLVHKNAL